MPRNAARQGLFSFVLVGVLAWTASGVLEVAVHDHDPGEYCRICSGVQTVDPTAFVNQAEPPRLEASITSNPAPASDTGGCLLVATPLRGPPQALS